MTECPSCDARVRPGQEECEHCGFPLDAGAPEASRQTRIDRAPPAASPTPGLFRPGARTTRIDAPDPLPSTPASDPFVAASAPRRRRTMIGAAAPASDPFAAALTPTSNSPEGGGALDRPLAGMLITFSGAPNGRLIPLTFGRTVIGREPGPPGPDVLALDDDSVSNRHCLVVAREAGVMVKDEMSSNGTLLRRAGEDAFRDILADTVQLADGDQLKLGETVLLLRLLDRERVSSIWGTP